METEAPALGRSASSSAGGPPQGLELTVSLDAALPFTSITLMQLLTAVAALVVGVILARIVLNDPEPAVVITELADSSVNLALRPWTKTENYWAVKGNISKAVLEGLPAAGVEIPFPQLDVHMSKE